MWWCRGLDVSLEWALGVWKSPGVGPVAFEQFLSNAGGHSSSRPVSLSKTVSPLPEMRWADAHTHRHLVFKGDPLYPETLRHIAAAPPFLLVEGDVALLSLSKQQAIVGARQASAVGQGLARAWSGDLAQRGWIVTSGLALGIDAAAHEGALTRRASTIAVLGTGPDVVYPALHKTLARQIVDRGGALVSEFPLGTPPAAAHFPRRNRIISGLSRGVLVVEAALKSGSLITARYALEQGKEVFAVPGSIQHELSKGVHALIKQGAALVESVEDLLSHYPASMA